MSNVIRYPKKKTMLPTSEVPFKYWVRLIVARRVSRRMIVTIKVLVIVDLEFEDELNRESSCII